MKPNLPATHRGIVETSFFSPVHRSETLLRELKLYWVSPTGLKFDKKSGVLLNEEEPATFLDLTTIRPIPTLAIGEM